MSELIHTVDLVRHAHSAMNALQADENVEPFIGGRQNEVPLDELGERQSTAAGIVLASEGFMPTMVLSSPAVRAMETCRISTLALTGASIEPIITPDFQELDQGDWTNKPRTLYQRPDIKERMERLGWDFMPPRGESMNMVADRVLWRLGELAVTLDASEDPQCVLAYLHGVATKCSVGRLLGWTHERTYRTRVGNVSRTRLVRTHRRWYVGQFAEDLIPKHLQTR